MDEKYALHIYIIIKSANVWTSMQKIPVMCISDLLFDENIIFLFTVVFFFSIPKVISRVYIQDADSIL